MGGVGWGGVGWGGVGWGGVGWEWGGVGWGGVGWGGVGWGGVGWGGVGWGGVGWGGVGRGGEERCGEGRGGEPQPGGRRFESCHALLFFILIWKSFNKFRNFVTHGNIRGTEPKFLFTNQSPIYKFVQYKHINNLLYLSTCQLFSSSCFCWNLNYLLFSFFCIKY